MRYVISAVLFIGLLVGVIFLLIKSFASGPTVKPINMGDYYNTKMQVRFVQDGIINSDQLHRSIAITVNKSNVNITVYQGYQGNILSSNDMPNNEQAYHNLLLSLNSLGYRVSKTSPFSKVNGLCPLGLRYSYQINNAPTNINQNLWSTTCSQGTIAGKFGSIQSVMKNQIPNYYPITNSVNLSQAFNQF